MLAYSFSIFTVLRLLGYKSQSTRLREKQRHVAYPIRSAKKKNKGTTSRQSVSVIAKQTQLLTSARKQAAAFQTNEKPWREALLAAVLERH